MGAPKLIGADCVVNGMIASDLGVRKCDFEGSCESDAIKRMMQKSVLDVLRNRSATPNLRVYPDVSL